MVRIIVVGQGDSETKEDSDNRRLSETEQLKAAMIGERLKKESAAKEYKLYTPDISRPRQAAEIIAGHMGLGIAEDRRLRGICKDYGQESWCGFYKRLSSCLDMICGEERKENLIFVIYSCCLAYTAAWWAKAFKIRNGEEYIMARPSISVTLLSDIHRAVPAS